MAIFNSYVKLPEGNFIGSSLSPWAMGNSPSIPGRCHGATVPHFLRSVVRSPDCHRTHRSNNDPKETPVKLLEVSQFHSKDVDLSIFINERSWISVKHCSFSRQLWVSQTREICRISGDLDGEQLKSWEGMVNQILRWPEIESPWMATDDT